MSDTAERVATESPSVSVDQSEESPDSTAVPVCAEGVSEHPLTEVTGSVADTEEQSPSVSVDQPQASPVCTDVPVCAEGPVITEVTGPVADTDKYGEKVPNSSADEPLESAINVPTTIDDTSEGVIAEIKEELIDILEDDLVLKDEPIETPEGLVECEPEEGEVEEELEEMVTCCAFGCNNNNNDKTAGLTFHRFPSDPKLRKLWTYAVRRKDWLPTPRSTVCSVHFREKWFDRTSLSVVRLREGAVPDIFPAIESILTKAMKRKAEDNIPVQISKRKTRDSQNTRCSSSENELSSGSRDIEETRPKRRISKLPGGSSSGEECSKIKSNASKTPARGVTRKTAGPALKKTARKSTTRPQENKKIPEAVSNESDDKTDGPARRTGESVRPKVKLVAKSTQTTVTLQQACNEMHRLQTEVITLRQQLELAREDNKRLQNRLSLLGPLTRFSGNDLKILANLLNEGEASSSEDDLPNPGVSKSGPGDIVVPSKTRTVVKGNQQHQKSRAAAPKKAADPNDIWDADEVQIVPTGDDVIKDPRHQPAVNIVYKQKVGSEDVFLQMGRKTPMTSSCESIIITLTMKGEKMKDIDCNITEKFLDIRSPLYRYHMPFPSSVNPDTAEAEWNTPASQLIISVDLVRELDAVNF